MSTSDVYTRIWEENKRVRQAYKNPDSFRQVCEDVEGIRDSLYQDEDAMIREFRNEIIKYPKADSLAFDLARTLVSLVEKRRGVK